MAISDSDRQRYGDAMTGGRSAHDRRRATIVCPECSRIVVGTVIEEPHDPGCPLSTATAEAILARGSQWRAALEAIDRPATRYRRVLHTETFTSWQAAIQRQIDLQESHDLAHLPFSSAIVNDGAAKTLLWF